MQNEVKAINNAIKKNKGQVLARYFDFHYINEHRDTFSGYVDSNFCSRLSSDFWRDVFNTIFQISQAPNQKEAFNLYNSAIMSIVRSFKDINTIVMTPIMKTASKSLKILALSGFYAESGDLLQRMLSLYHRTNVNGSSPILCISNCLVSVFFMHNNFKQGGNVLKIVEEHGISFENFETSEVVEFHFYKGKFAAISCDVEEAQKNLLFAFEHTPLSEKENRRLILAYLVPVQICCGILPSQELIEKYQLNLHAKFVAAVQQANPKMFEDALNEHQLEIIKLGQLDLIIKIKNIIYLRILQMVHDVYDSTKVPTELYLAALNEFEEFDIFDAESLISTLSNNGYVKAIISHQYKMIVFAKDMPFPLFENHK